MKCWSKRIKNSKHKKSLFRIKNISRYKIYLQKKKYNYPKSTTEIIAKNILNRKFNANCSNKKQLTDTTEFGYADCHKAYLSAILDL